jgi:hypothetical protein
LKLDAAETKAVTEAFRLLRPQVTELLKDADYLPKVASTLQAADERVKTGEFLAQMKSFYGVKDERPYRVHVLWAPPGFGRSTVWDHEVLLTITRKSAENEKDLPSWLGVVVHEVGHALLAQLPSEETAALARRIIDTGGVVNTRHGNIIDEATQTAVANIVFVRDRLPESFDRRSFYDYEPKNQFPDAIDSLARELEPLVPVALKVERGFATVLLPKALEAQRRLFGNTPLMHSRVGLLFYGARQQKKYFDGLFTGISRFSFGEGSEEDFGKASKDAATNTRWVVITQPQATPARMTQLAVPKDLRVKPGCAQARRRAVDAGYDVVVIGRDDENVGKILIALHRATAMPEKQPLCVP